MNKRQRKKQRKMWIKKNPFYFNVLMKQIAVKVATEQFNMSVSCIAGRPYFETDTECMAVSRDENGKLIETPVIHKAETKEEYDKKKALDIAQASIDLAGNIAKIWSNGG